MFPHYQAPYLGNGMVIGANAIVHVLVSHGVAIGAFAMLVLADAARPGRVASPGDPWERFSRRLLRFTVIVVTIVGAATGAGIWFTTSALAPRAITSMLRVFFWIWFIEWLVFVSEVVLLLLLYAAWDRLGARNLRRRRRLGTGYVLLALTSAVLITGNLAFMLTPGGWPGTRRLVDAFLNPTFPPQLLFRLSLSFAIGAQIALAFVLRGPPERGFRRVALPLFGAVLLFVLPGLVGGVAWYAAQTPSFYREHTLFAVLTSRLTDVPELLVAANVVAALVLAALALAALLRRPRVTGALLVPALALTVALTAEFERMREFVRGPYLMPGHLFVNQVLLEEEGLYGAEGTLAHSPWYRVAASTTASRDGATEAAQAGAFLFARSCGACHTVHGINDILARIEGRSERGLHVFLGRTSRLVSFMPPFVGSDRERRLTARFLHRLARGELAMESLSRPWPVAVESGAP